MVTLATGLVPVLSPMSAPSPAQVQGAVAPMWSPDGGRIAFASNQAGNWDIYVIELSSGAIRAVTDHPAADQNPAWSPDGLQLVFESDRDGDYELFITDLESGRTSQLTHFDATREGRPQFTPDGRNLYFHSMRGPRQGRYDTDIFVMSLDRPSIVRLVDGVGGDSYAAWDPRGAFILFGSNRDGPWELYRIASTGGGREKVVATSGDNAANFPSFAPGGERFVHQLVTEKGSDLFVVELDSGVSVNITGTPELYEVHPAWSPQGHAIAFSVRYGESEGPGELTLIAPDGTDRRTVPLRFPDRAPSRPPDH